MLEENEIKDLEKLSVKNEAVRKIFTFYKEATTNGKKAALISINKKWLDISCTVENTIIKIDGDDKTFKNFLDMTKLFGDMEKKELKHKTKYKIDEASFTDSFANKNRE